MNELIISKEKWGYLQSVGRWSPMSDEMQRERERRKMKNLTGRVPTYC